MQFVLYALLAYILYQFIFKLVIPVYMASRKIKKGFREMSARMNHSEGQSKTQERPFNFAQGQQQQGYTAQSTPSKPAPKTKPDDYIDFEEVK